VYEILTLFVHAAGYWFSTGACNVLVTEMAVICESLTYCLLFIVKRKSFGICTKSISSHSVHCGRYLAYNPVFFFLAYVTRSSSLPFFLATEGFGSTYRQLQLILKFQFLALETSSYLSASRFSYRKRTGDSIQQLTHLTQLHYTDSTCFNTPKFSLCPQDGFCFL